MILSDNGNERHAKKILTERLGVKDQIFINSAVMVVAAMIVKEVKKKFDNAKSKYRRNLTKCKQLHLCSLSPHVEFHLTKHNYVAQQM